MTILFYGKAISYCFGKSMIVSGYSTSPAATELSSSAIATLGEGPFIFLLLYTILSSFTPVYLSSIGYIHVNIIRYRTKTRKDTK